MRRMQTVCGLSLVMAVGGLAAAPVQAGVPKKVLVGLSEAGFNFVAEENFMSGGADLFVSRQFRGETLDFGATELTISGTPSFMLSTGGRGWEEIEITFDTGGSPLNYSLTTDTGNQITTLNGSFFLDASAKINQFGYYDVQLDLSSRQTFENEGRYSNDPLTEDFDIGPINIRGNIFADLLAVISDPIFQALGVDNIFAQFSASGQFQTKLDAEVARLRSKALSGQALTSAELAQLGSVTSLAAAYGFALPDMGFLADVEIDTQLTGDGVNVVTPRMAIPEPASAVLLLAGVPYLLRRKR